MNKKFKLEIPPFGATIWVLYGYKDNFVDVARTLKLRRGIMSEVLTYKGKDDYWACVYSNNLNVPKLLHLLTKRQSTIMHEAHHIVEFLGKYYGFSGHYETKAYLQEYLVKHIKQNLK